MVPGIDAWEAWPPEVMADRLAGLELPWYVAAGWALDLFLGTQTRPHDNLEIAIPDDRFAEIAGRFEDCDFRVPRDGALVPATPEVLLVSHQTWAWELATGRWRFDVFREPHDGDEWVYRRDPRIRRPYTEVIEGTPDGVPYLAPEVVLLFKAGNPRRGEGPRDKDEADLYTVLPELDDARLRWLEGALATVYPDHPWRETIQTE